jgi:hypothetical protein
MATSPDTPITLDVLGALPLLRQVQADQRNIRTEQETMRGLLVGMTASLTASLNANLSVFQAALLKRVGESEALMESRFDGIVALLAAPKAAG